MTLYTIGYERRQAGDVLNLAKQAGVEILVDVRADQRSRKPGMDPDTLRLGSRNRGMGYLASPSLGVPFRVRQHIRKNNLSWDEVEKIYGRILVDNESILQQLAETVSGQPCCLLCFERDPEQCHRSILAERLAEMVPGLNVVHL